MACAQRIDQPASPALLQEAAHHVLAVAFQVCRAVRQTLAAVVLVVHAMPIPLDVTHRRLGPTQVLSSLPP